MRGTLFGLGGGIAYVGFLLTLRHGGSDLRRPAGPLFDATTTATVVGVILGVIIGEADLVPDWPGTGWLIILAFTSQTLGWLLITVSLPRLPAALTSLLLMFQPVGSVEGVGSEIGVGSEQILLDEPQRVGAAVVGSEAGQLPSLAGEGWVAVPLEAVPGEPRLPVLAARASQPGKPLALRIGDGSVAPRSSCINAQRRDEATITSLAPASRCRHESLPSWSMSRRGCRD